MEHPFVFAADRVEQRHVRGGHDHDAHAHELLGCRDHRARLDVHAVPPVRPLPRGLQRHHAPRGMERAAGPQGHGRDPVVRLAQPHHALGPDPRRRGREAGRPGRGGPVRQRRSRPEGPAAGAQHAHGGLAASGVLRRRVRDLRRLASLHGRRGRYLGSHQPCGHLHRGGVRRHRRERHALGSAVVGTPEPDPYAHDRRAILLARRAQSRRQGSHRLPGRVHQSGG